MHAYDGFAEMHLELTGQFTAKALYRLSAPGSPDDAPDDAPDAAIEKARQGIRITEKSASELVEELAPSERAAADPPTREVKTPTRGPIRQE
jgi:hypothetical protein